MRFHYNFPDPPEGGDGDPANNGSDPGKPADPPAAPPKAPENKPDQNQVNWEQADRQARFWAKATPEERQRYMDMIEKQGTPQESEETKALRGEVEQMKKQSIIDKAMRQYPELEDEDEEWLQSLPSDAIMDKAKWQSERIARLTAGGSDTGKDGEPAPRKPREYKPADAPTKEGSKIAAELAKSNWFN